MELSHFDIIVVIAVNLLEDLIESEAALMHDLEQVVEDFILGVMVISVFLLFDGSLNVVLTHELVKFVVLNNAVLVFVNLLEECSDFVLFEAHIKVA